MNERVETAGIGQTRKLGIPHFARIPCWPWISEKSEAVLIIVFILLMLLPGAIYVTRSEQTAAENRTLAPAPSFASEPIAGWPESIDAYWRDHFGLRAQLILAHNTMRFVWLRVPSNQVLFGHLNWIFYYKEMVLEDFLGMSHFSQGHLRAWSNYLQRRHELLAKSGVKYLFVVVPNKSSVYPEMMPKSFQERQGMRRLEQLRSFLKQQKNEAAFLDLTWHLLAAKRKRPVFAPSDTHWNGYGYWAAYKAMVGQLQQWFPDMSPMRIKIDYAIEPRNWAQDGWHQLGLHERALGDLVPVLVEIGDKHSSDEPLELPPEIKDVKDPLFAASLSVNPHGKRTLLLAHDSFMRSGIENAKRLPLSEHFERVISVGQFLNDRQLMALIDLFQPDVFIEETVERYLGRVPPNEAGESIVPNS